MQAVKQYILSIDQGTSSTKTLLFDEEGKAVSRGSAPLQTMYLNNGWVEQDPAAIIENVQASVKDCLLSFTRNGGSIGDIKGIGISNQRETFIVWDKNGQPLYNAVVWQCKRSVNICERIAGTPLAEDIKAKTGLLVDPYFSGTKLMWLYEEVGTVRKAIDEGNAYFGTIDSWLLYQFTGGKSYYTDYTNASRTMFFNLSSLDWDQDLLKAFGLARLNLPRCKPSSSHFGETHLLGLLEEPLPITGMIGDSHAAAFGQGCFTPGAAKATLGTGCSILMNIGDQQGPPVKGMVTTICWSTEDTVQYALEGVIVTCGATLEWLKNELGLFTDSRQTEAMAGAVSDNQGVYLVPAFSGLGAPHWDMNRKAAIYGLTFSVTKHHVVRAALESIPYQIKDILVSMEEHTGVTLRELMVDGGMSGNRFIVQFLSDLIEKKVISAGMPDVSSLGAAYMAGLKAGVYSNLDRLKELYREKTIWEPISPEKTKRYYEGWKKVILS